MVSTGEDLTCHFVPWDGCDGWLAANRFAILAASRRATPVPAGAARAEDAVARGKARDALSAALKSRDDAVSSEAAFALGLAGDVRDIPTLAAIVADARASRRMQRLAALGLGELPAGNAAQADEARKALLGALADGIAQKDKLACFWSDCAYALAMRGEASTVPRLVELRRKAFPDSRVWTSPELVGAICYAIGVLGGDAQLPELELELRARRQMQDFVGDAAWSIPHALGRMGGEKALTLLRQTTHDEREFVRIVAVQALGGAVGPADEESAQALRDAMAKDVYVPCRQMAAIGLGRMGSPAAGAALATALDHASSVDKRFYAVALALWLRRTPDAKLAAQISGALEKSHSQDDRVSLAIACGLAGIQTARAAVVDTMPKNRGGPNAAAASFALGLLGAGPAERKLLHEVVAQSADPTSRREAAVALGLLRDHEVVDRLRAIVRSKGSDLDRGSAACCLGLVGDDADIDFVVGMIAEHATSDPLRACLVHGLGRLLDRAEGAGLARVVAGGRWYRQQDCVDPFSDIRSLVD
jgi:HEAT repeat protein